MKRIQEKKRLPNTKEDIDLIALVFQQLFKDSALLSTWWVKITSLVEITANIEILSVILSTLPSDHPTGCVPLFDFLINASKSYDLQKKEIDSLHLFNAVKR